MPRVPFTDVTDSAGLDFIHENGAAGEKLLPETMGSGCAFFDYDKDGDQDLLLVNGSRWPGAGNGTGASATTSLYRNIGSGQFENVTAGSGLDAPTYGVGVAVGDYDDDGLSDVFISSLGHNTLFHNEGGGRFADVTEAAGVGGETGSWSTSCGWFDYDRDGDLDLFVCNYLVWSRDYDLALNFQLIGGGRAYGRPQSFPGTFPYLYRNDGNGRFSEVSEEAGLRITDQATGRPLAKSLGVTFADLDQDGWIDILVANDTVRNFLFHNQQDGTFHEVGAASGIAFDVDGNVRGAMGIDVAEFRNDGSLGVAIGNFSDEMTALYVKRGTHLSFIDEAIANGLGQRTRDQLTFGVFYFDADLDGKLDLFAANGHLETEIHRIREDQQYAQPPQLFWNSGMSRGSEFLLLTSEECGEDLLRPVVGRGAAYADIDTDGDLDLLVTTIGESPRLFRNDQQCGHHWLRIVLRTKQRNVDAIGTWVEVVANGRVLRQQVMPTRSYLSQVELPITFGLGESARIEKLTVYWPDGSTQSVPPPAVDQQIVVNQEI